MKIQPIQPCFHITSVQVEIDLAAGIQEAVRDTLGFAIANQMKVEFEFNGLRMVIDPREAMAPIMERWEEMKASTVTTTVKP